MPSIGIELIRGRTISQKRDFVKAVTAAAIEHLAARTEDVRVVFWEMERADVARAGVLAADMKKRRLSRGPTRGGRRS